MTIQCFVRGGFPVADKPCAGSRTSTGFYSCCGPSDTCLDNKLCHKTNPTPGASGYYTQSCSDQSFSDGACDQQCSNQLTDDVVYNTTTNLWACCGNSAVNGAPKCSNPTNETFSAPPPQSLLANTIPFTTPSSAPTFSSSIALSSASSSSTSTPSTSPTTSPASSSSSSSPTPSSTPPGPNAKAGIAVGATIGGLILLAALIFLARWILRKRGYAKPPLSPSATQPRRDSPGAGGDRPEMGERPATISDGGELPAERVVREMDAERGVRELGGGGWDRGELG